MSSSKRKNKGPNKKTPKSKKKDIVTQSDSSEEEFGEIELKALRK